jgi:hypothetical protein
MNEAKKVGIAATGIALFAGAVLGSPSQRSPIQRQLEDFVQAANQAWVEAARTLESRGLSEWFSGAALEDQVNQLHMGREHQARIEYEKPSITFRPIVVGDDSEEVSVVTEEGWAFQMVDTATGRCLSRRDKNSIRVTYRLKRSAGVWTIFSVEQEYLADRPPSRPCAQ